MPAPRQERLHREAVHGHARRSPADARLGARAGLRVGSAPDTFLGGAHQTCRALIDRGDIGEPLAAAAFMACHGHEHWHPSPEFYYQVGGGPLFGMGPYYLSALINLLGPMASVAGAAKNRSRNARSPRPPSAAL